MTFSDIFLKKGNIYFSKFYSKTKREKDKIRKLDNLNETEGKNETDIVVNNTENENGKNKNSQKSGIGWLGISLIILLSFIVIYVIYVGFRYYRRKKYQNPSFYYKITEEMFDDITPIE